MCQPFFCHFSEAEVSLEIRCLLRSPSYGRKFLGLSLGLVLLTLISPVSRQGHPRLPSDELISLNEGPCWVTAYFPATFVPGFWQSLLTCQAWIDGVHSIALCLKEPSRWRNIIKMPCQACDR